jgi:hypothetical protein
MQGGCKTTDETTSHLTRLSKNASQVIGYAVAICGVARCSLPRLST